MKRKMVAMASVAAYLLGSTTLGFTPAAVAAIKTGDHTVTFNYKVAMDLTLSTATVNFGDVYAYDGELVDKSGGTINVKTNKKWGLTVESLGRDGVEGGDDDSKFATAGAERIDVNKLNVTSAGGFVFKHDMTGAPVPVLENQLRTTTGGRVANLTYTLTLDGNEDLADGYRTVIRYTAFNS
ncbi:MAG: hypothetical protein QMD53_00445 [Actinomycetota bacterium]|nr:hypothetical protein [Actinomycetota bacterium]